MVSSRRSDIPVGDAPPLQAETWPGAGPRAVLLHADVADRRSWYAVAERLEGCDLLAYDRRGFGGTPAGDAEFRHVDDLVAVLDSDPRGALVVGSAGGARHAIDATLLRPDRVAGLVLVAPGVSGSPPPVVDAGSLILIERLRRAYADRDQAEVSRLHTWLWLDGPLVAEGRVSGLTRSLAVEMVRQEMWRGAVQSAGASEMDAWSRLGTLAVPVTVACGDLDLPHLVEQARQVSQLIPHASFVALAGTAHLPMLDAPGAVADLIRAALPG